MLPIVENRLSPISMKILVHDYAGHPFQVQLSRELARLGHQVLHAFSGSLQTPRGQLSRGGEDPETLEIAEIPMDPRYSQYKYDFRRRRGMEIGYGKRAAGLIRDWKPDAVLSANTPTDSQGPIARETRHGGGRFIVWVQDIYSVAIDSLLRKKIPVLGAAVGTYYRAKDKNHLKQADHVVAIADDFRPILREEFGVPEERISVIGNWAPLESLPLLPKRNEWAASHELDDKFCFLYSGTLGLKHNPELLLELARSHRGRSDVRVVVISEGTGAEWLADERRRHHLENLVLLPYQPFERIPEVLAAGDVLLGILNQEAGVFSVPSKVLTYLCAGRPLLLAVPPENQASRIVATANAGITLPPDDLEGFLEGARHLLEGPGERRIMGRNARDFAETTFKIADIAVKFEDILKN